MLSAAAPAPRRIQNLLLRPALLVLACLGLSACGGSTVTPYSSTGTTDELKGSGVKARPIHTPDAGGGLHGAAGLPEALRLRIQQQAAHTTPAAGSLPAGAARAAAPLKDAPLAQGLPTPEQLARSVSATTPGLRYELAEEYDSSLPNQRISVVQDGINFVPNGTGFKNAALATYRFALPGDSGPQSIETYWNTPPVAGTLFYAVADFNASRWVWFDGDAVTALTLPTGSYFNNDSELFIVVLTLGVAPSQLNYLRFGGDRPPTASLTADTVFADAPYTANLSGALSSDEDGEIAQFDWDLDNDGSFETMNAGPEQSVQLDTPGSTRQVNLRVKDAAGQTATTSLNLTADSPGYDEIEPNDSSVSQFLPAGGFSGWDGNIGEGGYDGGTIDGYAVEVDSPCWLHFNLDGAAGSSLPAAMILLQDDGLTTVAVSNTFVEDGRLDARITAAGNYILAIQCAGASGNMDYELGCAVVPDSKYDEVEDNDNPPQADALKDADVLYFTGNLGTGGYDGDTADFTNILGHAGEACRLHCEFPVTDVDIDIELLAPDGSTVLASSVSDGSTETIDFVFPDDQEYFLRTYFKDGSPPDAHADYCLSLDYLGVAPTAALSVTPHDGPSPLTVTVDTTGCVAAPGQTIDHIGYDWNSDGIDDFSADPSSFQMVLYDPISYNITARVYQSDGIVNSAQDYASVTGTYGEVEPNDTIDTYQGIPGGWVTDLLAEIGPGINHGGNDDFYGYTAGVDGTVSFNVEYEAAMPGMAMILYINGNYVDQDQSADGSLSINTNVLAGDVVTLQVFCDDNTQVAQGYHLSSTFN